ncbi:MAG: hypothetical protein HRU15_09560, partial [Planctomycetes bacterium]|nr:hypothetical protein [Planctomycetota bacterium]
MKFIHVCTLMCLIFTLNSAEQYPWQETHAKVLASGDLEWTPHAFVFNKGTSTRYI